MAIYYVSQLSGNDSFAGTDEARAKLTVNGAWAVVAEGDTIEIIDSETYTGSSNYNLANQVVDIITVRAKTGKTPIIDGGGSANYFIRFDENYTFSGLTFQNFVAGDAGILTHRTSSGITRLTVTDCIFRENTGQILDLDQVSTVTTIQRCQFYNNASQQESGGGSSAIQVYAGTQRVSISNCLFYNLGPRNVGFNIIDSRNSSTSITHCTFAKRDASVVNPQIPTRLFKIGGGDFKFNLLYEFEASSETILATTGGDISYNSYGNDSSVSGSWSGSAGPVNGGTAANNVTLTANPGFVSYEANDYRLNKGARTIALDAASGSTEAVDLTGRSRLVLDQLAYNSGILDMGCYESNFYTPIESEPIPQISSNFTINTHLLSRVNFHRGTPMGGSVSETLQQVPFSVGVNGFIPSVVKQTGIANNAKQPRVSYSNAKGDSKSR